MAKDSTIVLAVLVIAIVVVAVVALFIFKDKLSPAEASTTNGGSSSSTTTEPTIGALFEEYVEDNTPFTMGQLILQCRAIGGVPVTEDYSVGCTEFPAAPGTCVGAVASSFRSVCNAIDRAVSYNVIYDCNDNAVNGYILCYGGP